MSGAWVSKVVVAALCAGGPVFAQTQAGVSDAQVEASVLKALAAAPELSTQNIQTSTTYGEVTITGMVADETLRTRAENIVARVPGVKKVIDQLTLGVSAPTASSQGQSNPPNGSDSASVPQDAQGQNMVLQSDGTYAPAAPPQDQNEMAAPTDNTAQAQTSGQSNEAYNGQANGGNQAYDASQGAANQAPQAQANSGGYGNAQQEYGYSPDGRQPLNGVAPPPLPPRGYQPQHGGAQVTIPPGAVLNVRINRGIDSQHIEPGTPFNGTIMNDIIAGGQVAIPRGATVYGVVADAERTKALSGRGELSLQITGVQLGGQTFPLQTNVWAQVGRDKTTSTVNHGVIGGILGALVGGAIGGGAGAAVGAGVGAGAGVATAAGSPHGDVLIAPESVLNFQTTTPTTVITVGEREMERLSYAAGPVSPPAPRYYGRPYYYPY